MFEIVSKYKPSGDQPQAIKKLVEGIKNGLAMGSIFALMALGYSMVYGIVACN